MTDQQQKYREEIADLNDAEILNRIRIYENNIRIMKNQENQLKHEESKLRKVIDANKKKL